MDRSAPATVQPSSPAVFREEQHFNQWWLWILVIVPAGLCWWPFIEQVVGGRPVGQNPGPDWLIWIIWILIGIGLPVLFGYAALILEVSPAGIRINYRPFVRRTIALADIDRVEARTYNAIKEYGGWGIKGWSKDKMAYNVSGNRGVEVHLRDGRSVMLGSRRSDELAAAIQSLRRPPMTRAGTGSSRG